MSEESLKVLVGALSNATTKQILAKMELVNVVKSTLNLDPVTALELIEGWIDGSKHDN